MDDEIKQQRAINRGQRAQTLLDDELLKEAFGSLKTDYYKVWMATTKPEERERIWQASNLIEKVHSHLEAAVRTGSAAKLILKDIQAKRQRKAA